MADGTTPLLSHLPFAISHQAVLFQRPAKLSRMSLRPGPGSLYRHAWLVLAAVASLIPFAGGLSTTNVFFVRDLGLYFWPRHLCLWQSWRDGDWPFWDPYVGAGQSAVADALNHFFLLPVTLVRVLAPPVVGFNFWVAAPFPILVVGFWLWLRRRFAPAAVAAGAAIVALAGPIASTGDFPNLSWTVALIPWILWSVDRVCERPTPASFAALAACVGFQAAAGEPVTFAGTCAVVAGYAALALSPFRGISRRAGILRVSAAIGAGVLLAAVQLVPLGFAATRSTRGATVDAGFWSLHPLMLLETVLPHFFGHAYTATLETLPWIRALNAGREPLLYSLYIGIGAFALALVRESDVALTRWRRFWWCVLGVAVIGALGEFTPVYPAVQAVVPVLKAFRFPVKYLLFGVLAVAALATSGADALIRHARGERDMRLPLGAGLVLGATALVAGCIGAGSLFDVAAIPALWRAVAHRAAIADPIGAAAWLKSGDAVTVRLAGLAVGTGFLLTLVWNRHRSAVLATWAICGLAVLDPLAVNADLYPTIPASLLGPPEWVEATHARPGDRVYVGGRLTKNTGRQQMPAELIDSPSRFLPPAQWSVQEAVTLYSSQLALTPAAWRVRDMISYDLPQLWPREYGQLLIRFRKASREDRLRLLRRTGVRYCFVPEPPVPGATPLAAPEISRPMALYTCDDNPRRVYVTTAATIEPDLGRQLDLLFEPSHDPFASVLLERSAPAVDGTPGAGAVPAAEIVREGNTQLEVRVAIPDTGGYLTVVDSYDPFWVVDVDGKRGTLLRANGLFRAVHLAPGTHDVRFAYRPLPFYVGLAISSAVGLLLIAGCVWRRAPPAGC